MKIFDWIIDKTIGRLFEFNAMTPFYVFIAIALFITILLAIIR
jgi:hypothetical protein